MATKTLTITSEAYERLAAFKDESESFSEVINRLMGGRSWLMLKGILSTESATELRKHIKDVRTENEHHLDKMAKRLA